MTLPVIAIDDRGKLCDEAKRRLRDMAFDVEVKRLDDVDLHWEGRVPCYVELKTATDLVGSLSSSHMQDQEARLIEMDGAKFVVVVGEILPASNGGTLAEDVWYDKAIHRVDYTFGQRKMTGYADKSYTWTHYPYAGAVNYQQRLQELGIGVVTVARLADLGVVLASIIQRSTKASSQVPMRRRVESLDPRVAAVKSLPEFRSMPTKAVESLVARYWRHPLDLNGVSVKELESLPGVGKTIANRITAQ